MEDVINEAKARTLQIKGLIDRDFGKDEQARQTARRQAQKLWEEIEEMGCLVECHFDSVSREPFEDECGAKGLREVTAVVMKVYTENRNHIVTISCIERLDLVEPATPVTLSYGLDPWDEQFLREQRIRWNA